MKNTILWCVALVGTIALPAWATTALAATYVVDQAKGNDAADGSAATPWQTLSRGVKDLKPGDTLTVNAGTYRETVNVTCRGTAESPITIQAAPGARAAITGADAVTGWKPCTPEMAAGHPQAAKILYADIAWLPVTMAERTPTQRATIPTATTLYHLKRERPLARFPAEGWQPATRATATTLVDEKALTQPRDCWQMAPVSIRFADGKVERRTVASFDPATHTLTLSQPLPEGRDLAKVEYQIEGRLPGLLAAGQWAWEPTGERSARLFFLPPADQVADGDVELARRSHQLVLDKAAHVIVDGFDMGYGVYASGGDSVVYANVGGATDGAGQGLVIRRCTMHHHKRFGAFFQGCDKPKLQNCLIAQNTYGIMLAGNQGALVEECEIGPNVVDGLRDTWGGRGTIVRRCYIHHHFDSMMHSDNVQLHDGVSDILFDSNLLLCGGQSMMMSKVDGLTLRNNVILGSAANMVICLPVNGVTMERNTCALGAMSIMMTGQCERYKLTGNIMVNTGGSRFYYFEPTLKADSDQNLFWSAAGTGSRLWQIGKDTVATLDALKKLAPLEAGSEFRDPQFASAPNILVTQDWQRREQCTRERIIVNAARLFQPGDHVETNFDGVARTVKAVDGDAVIIDPPMEKTTVFIFLANWKDKTVYKYDYKTPLGEKYGSTLSVPQYQQGDFNGDGKRDVPSL
jgi:hypothetical protein